MKRTQFVAVLACVAGAAIVVCAIQGVRVTMNGKPATGRMIDGSVYVKLADVAKAFDQTVVSRNGVYEVVPAGGANALKGTQGKKGEELYTGKWKFLVKEVVRSDSYMLKYHESKFELKADEGQELVVIECRFKNAINESVDVYFNGLANTALTDMEEQAYKPKWVDVGGGVASMMLPGSAKNFALIFQVPKSAQVKDLIYTVEPVDSRKYGAVDLRISLK